MTTRATHFTKGDTVTWKWGTGIAEGTIKAVYTDKVTHGIKGKAITRNASPDEPAYLIEQADGQEVLKSESELTSN